MTLADWGVVASIVLGGLNILLLPLVRMLWNKISLADSASAKALTDSETAANTAHEAKRLAVMALDKLNEHRIHVAENFTHNKAFSEFRTELFAKLDQIERKVDSKADKS